MSIWAVVPAAGVGERLGGAEPKALRRLGGRALIVHVVAALLEGDSVAGIVVVGPAEVVAVAREVSSAVVGVPGGRTRQVSVRAGLEALPGGVDKVLIHDAARPLVTPDLVERVASALEGSEAVVPAIPASDTLKRTAGAVFTPGRDEPSEILVVEESIPRQGLWHAQTPQGFSLPTLTAAHERALGDGFEGTDDAMLVERIGVKPLVVRGEATNIKITTRDDLELAEAILAKRERP